MRKILLLFFALFAFSVTTYAGDKFTVGVLYYEVTSEVDHTVKVRGNTISSETDLVIPATVINPDNDKEYKVTEINSYAFYEYERYFLTSVEIPNSVTKIGANAFQSCKFLTSVELPNSVTEIGDYAFEFCESLTSVEIPSSVKVIGCAPFHGCYSLNEIVVAPGNSQYRAEDGILYNIDMTELIQCPGAKTSVVIPNSVAKIGENAFGWSCLASVEIPNSVTEIGESAFSDCNLTSVEIPNSVAEIGEQTFSGCDSLVSVKIPNSVTKIGEYAFRWCESLASIELPNSVTEIGKYAFLRCESLASVEIPNSVTEIGSGAFESCESLTSIEIPNSVTEIGWGAFQSCESLTSIEIPNSVTEIDGYTFNECSQLASVKIPNSVTYIGGSAFCKCEQLTSIKIPNSVTEIGECAFKECTSLKDVYCYAEEPPILGSKVFIGISEDAILYIPEGKVRTYRLSDWNEYFRDMREIEESGIESVEADSAVAPAEYYNLNGIRRNSDALTPGVYIRSRGGKSEKVLVR